MPADAANRSTVRNALTTLLSSALVGAGKPVQAVYGYRVGKIEESPVVIVASSSSSRRSSGMNDTRWKNIFVYEVIAFLRDAVENNANWTEEDVEDTLDLIDKEIADTIADNRVNSNWSFIGFASDPQGNPEPSEIILDTERGYVIETRKVYVHYMETG